MPSMRLAVSLLLVVSSIGIARAEDRIELELVPDLTLLEPVLRVDGDPDSETTTRAGIGGSLGLGIDTTSVPLGASTLGAGVACDRVIAAARSELLVAATGLARGHHGALVEVRSRNKNEGVGGVVGLGGELDHGEARGLAPVRLGPGRRTTGEVALDGMLHIGTDTLESAIVMTMHGGAGATRWHDAPGLEHARLLDGGLGLGLAFLEGEHPRGTIDVVRSRIEHTTIRRSAVPGARILSRDTAVRIVEIGFGTTELTFHDAGNLQAVLETDLGWSWLEADASSGRIDDNALRMRLSGAMRWRIADEVATIRKLGLAFARTPTYSPDGERVVGDWRVELMGSVDSPRYLVAVRGGLSWLVPLAGGEPATTLIRYGSQLEGFLKLASGFEVGGYHAHSYEPGVSGDPWAAPRRWSLETGGLLRWRR